MALATIVDDHVVIHTEYHERAQIRLVPGARYDKEERYWTAPLTWSTCVTLRGVFGDILNLSPQLTDWAWQERRRWVDDAMLIRQALNLDETLGPRLQQIAADVGQIDNSRLMRAVDALRKVEETLAQPLFGLQRVAAVMMAVTGSMILGDDMGTGKTRSTVIAIRVLAEMGEAALPALIVAPNSVKRPWAREIAIAAPMLTSIVVSGGAKQRREQLALVESGEADVAIINWEALRLHSRQSGYGQIRLTDSERRPRELNMVNFRTIVADEAHKAKDPMAQQTRALWGAAEGASFRFALTGTPLVNQPEDFWSILHFVNPNEWESRTRFVDRYTLQTLTLSGRLQAGLNPATGDEFFRIIDPRFRRIPYEIGMPQLPPLMYERRDVEMTPAQQKAYVQMRDTMVAELDTGDAIAATTVLAWLTRLLQFSSAMAHLDLDNQVHLTKPSCKVDALVEILDELPEDQSIVVFALSRKLIELAGAELERRGVSHAYITGAVNERERDQNMQDFQAGRVRVMLCTIGAGGIGITLTRARVAVFLQRSWSAVENAQAEARVHRIGSEVHSNILIIDLVAKSTIEEQQIIRVMDKMDVAEELLRDRAFIRSLVGEPKRRRGER